MTVSAHLLSLFSALCTWNLLSRHSHLRLSRADFPSVPRYTHKASVLSSCDPIPSRWGRSGDWLPIRGRGGRLLPSARLALHCASRPVWGARPRRAWLPARGQDAHISIHSSEAANILHELGHGPEEEAADLLCGVWTAARPGPDPLAHRGRRCVRAALVEAKSEVRSQAATVPPPPLSP